MEKFTLRVASKRQMTIPVRLLELLHIDEGDVLELTAKDGVILSGKGLKLVPASLFTAEMLEDLKRREKSLDLEDIIDVNNIDQLAAKILTP
jgi:bifunctional DNA-binding transcriptional regulator/antitoxin component of YhaV-PrlF toxin-antitoxin module